MQYDFDLIKEAVVLMSSGGRYAGPRENNYLFIDGGCLRAILEQLSNDYFGGSIIELDYDIVRGKFTKVFYYDCIKPRKKDESEDDYKRRIAPQEELHNHIRGLNGYHVYEGIARRRRKKDAPEQKKVDVMIAVDMLTHTYMGNMHRATLMTSDLDFVPLINALVWGGMYVELWYQKGRTNDELIYSADSQKCLTVRNIYQWATKNFRKSNRLPDHRDRSLNIEGFLKEDSLPSDSGLDISLYKRRDRDIWMVTFPSQKSHVPNSYTHVTFKDRDILLRYVQEFWPYIGLESRSN